MKFKLEGVALWRVLHVALALLLASLFVMAGFIIATICDATNLRGLLAAPRPHFTVRQQTTLDVIGTDGHVTTVTITPATRLQP